MMLQELACFVFLSERNNEANDIGVIRVICDSILHLPLPSIACNKEDNVKEVRELYTSMYTDGAFALRLLTMYNPEHLDYYLSKVDTAVLMKGVIELIEQKEKDLILLMCEKVDFNRIADVPEVLDLVENTGVIRLLMRFGFDLVGNLERVLSRETFARRNALIMYVLREVDLKDTEIHRIPIDALGVFFASISQGEVTMVINASLPFFERVLW